MYDANWSYCHSVLEVIVTGGFTFGFCKALFLGLGEWFSKLK